MPPNEQPNAKTEAADQIQKKLQEKFEELTPKILTFLEKEAPDAPLYSVINSLVYILDQCMIPQMKEQVEARHLERYVIDICNTLLESAGARFRVPDIETIDELASRGEEAREDFLREIPPAGHS